MIILLFTKSISTVPVLKRRQELFQVIAVVVNHNWRRYSNFAVMQ